MDGVNVIDIATIECVEALLDIIDPFVDGDNVSGHFEDIVGNALERYGLWVMRQELARCNAVLSVFEANVKHLDVAPHWTTAKCGYRWLVYYDNLAVTLDETERPNYRTFGYASEAIEWVLEHGSIKYPSNSPQVQNEAESTSPSNEHQMGLIPEPEESE